MADVIYKNILLKDNHGNVLLPMTVSYYVEYKDGIDVKSYLDTLSSGINSVAGDIEEINTKLAENGEFQENIIDAVNEILVSYVQKPDHASDVVFNTSYSGLSDELANLAETPDNTSGSTPFVSTQRAIEVLDGKLSYTLNFATDTAGDITDIKSDITNLNSYTTSLDSRMDDAEGTIAEHTTYINQLNSYVGDIQESLSEIFDGSGNFVAYASAIKYTGSAGAGTDGQTNVQDAIDAIGTKLEGFNTEMEALVNAAGVTYVRGAEGSGVMVAGTGSETPQNNVNKQGSVSISLNLGTEGKLKVQDGVITVDESKLSNIPTSALTGYISSDMIDGGLGADNINITYSYTDGEQVLHNDGEKSVQEFYNETTTTLTEIQSSISEFSTSYQVTVTSDTADATYARVYTISQGGSAIGTINIPKDQFLRDVEYTTYEGSYALVFTWNYGDEDATTGAPQSYIPISAFVKEITNEIAGDVTELKTTVSGLSDTVDAIENSYIAGVTLDGVAGTVDANHIVSLSSSLSYLSGNAAETISDGFLNSKGITLS